MAKLDVTVLDMTDGEITKVLYNNVKYSKAEGTVESIEDILLATQHGTDRVKGNFYKIASNSRNMVCWEGDTSTNGAPSSYIESFFAVFRKERKPLHAGDFVKWKENYSGSLPNDRYYEVFEDENEQLYILDADNDKRWHPLTDDRFDYEIATKEEVKWLNIGRKVNEYKVGDIVKVLSYNFGHAVGTFVEITSVKEDVVSAKTANAIYTYKPDRLELIAPVESRF